MSDCLFCKIIAGDIPADTVYEDDQIMVFKDINPRAAVHLLVIPKLHLDSLDEVTNEHQMLIGHIMMQLPQLARSQGLDLCPMCTVKACALCAGGMLMFMHKAQPGRAGGQLLPLQPNSSFEDVRRVLESSTPASEHMYGTTSRDHNSTN